MWRLPGGALFHGFLKTRQLNECEIGIELFGGSKMRIRAFERELGSACVGVDRCGRTRGR